MIDKQGQLRFFKQYYLYLMGMHETLQIVDEKSYEISNLMGREAVMLAVLYGVRQLKPTIKKSKKT